MRRTTALLVLCLLLPLSALAQEGAAAAPQVDARIRRIELALNVINGEQQSIYQQFQMVQELRRGAMERAYESNLSYTPPATPPSYDDVVRERYEREQRIRQYGEELDRLYAHYRELDARKQTLLDALSQIALER
ncbi:MAG TPA: hypothetical protein VFB54_03870 [Burkholderiales bacterium]|nr:hypothetical protein [Burkholderiales bacterium]